MKTIKLGKLTFTVSDDKSLDKVEKKSKKAGKALKDTGNAAHTADRRLKGAAQASSNTTKNFSKMAQGVSGGLVPAYATLAAQLFALGALFRGLQQAADFRVLNEGMKSFAANSGVMVKTLARNLQEATGYQIAFREAAQASQIMLAAGFNEDQMGAIAKAARGASTALGRDFEDSFNRLVRGVTKAEPELLDELGIILRLEPATKKYATAMKKSAKDLTTFEKSQAVLNEVLTQAEEKYGAVGEAVDINAYNKLITTFIDLKDEAMAFITPVAEALANFFTNNIGSAVAALAIFVTTLTSSVFPAFDQLNEKINSSLIGRLGSGLGTSFAGVREDFKKATSGTGVQKASKAVKGFDSKAAQKSSGMQAIKNQEKLNRQQVQGIKRALKLAEDEYRKHGKITTGIFAGENINKVRNFKVSFQQMTNEARLSSKITRVAWTFTFNSIKGGIKLTAAAFKLAMKGMAFVAKSTARMVNVAFKAVAIFGWVTLIIDAYNALKANFDKVAAFFAKAINFIADQVDRFAVFVMKLFPEIGKGIGLLADKIRGGAEKIESDLENGTGWIGKMADEAEKQRPGSIIAEQFEGAKERITEAHDEFKEMMKERARTAEKSGKGLTGAQLFEANVATMASASISGKASVLLGAEKAKEMTPDQLSELREKLIAFGTDLGSINPEVATLFQQFKDGTIDTQTLTDKLKIVDTAAGAQNTAFKQLNNTIAAFNQQYQKLSKRGPLDDLLSTYKGFEDTIKMTGANKEDVVTRLYQTLFGERGDATLDEMTAAIDRFGESLKSTIDAQRRLGLEGADINTKKAVLGERKDARSALLQVEYKKEQLSIATQLAEEKVNELSINKQMSDEDEYQLSLAEKKLALARAQEKEYTRANTIVGQLNDTFQDGLDDMFKSIIDGSAKAKDAFKQLAVVVIQEMQRILAARMASQIIGMMSGMFTPTNSTEQATNLTNQVSSSIQIPDITTRYGGVVGKGYAAGGIADGPQSGYNVLMHGREAIVPLPDGDKIPVQLTGKGQGPVNSVINVTVNNEGDTETSAEESTALGEAIQMAVTREIAEQQRPGGLLSPI